MTFDPQAYAKSIGHDNVPEWLKKAAQQKGNKGTNLSSDHASCLGPRFSTNAVSVPMTDEQKTFYSSKALQQGHVVLNPIQGASRFNVQENGQQKPFVYGGKHYIMQAEDRHFWDGLTGADDYAKRAQEAFKGNVYAPEGGNLQSQADTIYRANYGGNSSDKRYVPVEVNPDGSPLGKPAQSTRALYQNSSMRQAPRQGNKPSNETILNGLNSFLGNMTKPVTHPITGPFTR